MLSFFPLKIAEIRRETPSAISLAFDVPFRWRQHFRFRHGQYLTVRAKIDGRDERRAYSICSGIDDGEMRIAIKRIEGGRFSSHAVDTFRPGQFVDVMPPHGRFTVALEPAQSRIFVGIAAGSGITPVMSILKSVLSVEPQSRFALYYGNRSLAETLFQEELIRLSTDFPGRLIVRHFISREDPGIAAIKGKIDGTIAGLIADDIGDPSAVDGYFVCGPDTMMTTVGEALEKYGVRPTVIHMERFGAPLDGGDVPDGVALDATVSLRLNGRTFEFVPGSRSIADAAIASGIPIPYSCGAGICAICKGRVLDGNAYMPDDTVLDPAEISAGFVLTCRSRPLTRTLLVDCDVD